jgi:hypothetical protein
MTSVIVGHNVSASSHLHRVARLAQAATLLAMVLIVFHLFTAVFMTLVTWNLTIEAQFHLLHSLIGDSFGRTASEAAELGVHRIQLGAAVVVVPYALLELAIFPLWKFFGTCAANNAFTSEAQQHLIASAVFFIIFSLIKPFQTTVMWLVETWGTAHYSSAWPIRITDTHLLTLFLSVALLGIVSVISEAIKVSQENREFV